MTRTRLVTFCYLGPTVALGTVALWMTLKGHALAFLFLIGTLGLAGLGGYCARLGRKPKITFSQCRVDGPYVAMTFDDGPHPANTPRLLDMLKQREIHATFFVVGRLATASPNIVQRMVAEGHEIANHSWSHPQLSSMAEDEVRDQLQQTHDALIQTTGVTPKIMRPPYGAFTHHQRSWAQEIWGYKCVLWNVDPEDWKYLSAGHVKDEILKATAPGSIILSHDIHESTVDAMPETLDGLLARGFKFVTVSELLVMDRRRLQWS
jgi:peptidoglycan/xylan/chitin deacetylase (PgdA/CDA1 family)